MTMKELTAIGLLGILARTALASSTITGTVRGPGDSLLPYAQITAYRNTGSYYDWQSSVGADGAGHYSLTGLPAGQYKVKFDSDEYIIQYYNGKTKQDLGDAITVGPNATVSNVNAILAPGSTLSGSVTDAGGTGLDGIQVTAYVYNGNYYDWYRSTATFAGGTYSIGGLPAGQCRIEFSQWEGTYATEWYNDTPYRNSASDIPVPALATVSNINASLVVAARIRGTVTGSNGVDHVQGINVTPYLKNGTSWEGLDGTTTEADGTYDLGGLPPGQYLVYFQDWQGIYAPEYYSNAPSQSAATEFNAAGGTTVSNINARLEAAGSIAGTVTGLGGTPAVGGMQVSVYRWSDGQWDWFDATWTDGAGAYEASGLPSGTYHISFEGTASFAGEWYDNQPDQGSATDIVLGAAQHRTNINASLSSGAHITGTVTSTAGGLPLTNVYVYADRWAGNDWVYAQGGDTDASGNYDIAGLLAGAYRVYFSPQDGAYFGEWWNDQSDANLASNIVLATGVTVGGISAALAPAARIRGTVTGPEGKPVNNIQIEAYRWDGGQWAYEASVSTLPYGAGAYILGPLREGSYQIRFHDYSDTYLTEYFNNAPDAGSATPITLAIGETHDGVDAQMEIAPTPAGISGTVTDYSTGLPLDWVGVGIYTNSGSGWEQVGSDLTDGEGFFTVSHVEPGTYRVRFFDVAGRGYISQWWNGAPDVDSASDITVLGGILTTNIDAAMALPPPNGISGTVTAEGGTTALSNIMVMAYAYDAGLDEWVLRDWTYTLTNGTYAIQGLDPDTYHVRFEADTAGYFSEWYDNVTDASAALGVDVTDGSMTTNIEARLTRMGRIEGTITHSDGITPLPGKRIGLEIWDGAAWQWADNTSNDELGQYRFDGLHAGQYRVQFYDFYSRFGNKWYDNQVSEEEANPVILAEGETRSGIDASLVMTDVPLEPEIIGLGRTTEGKWEVQFTGEWDGLYRLQGTTSPTGTWDDIGAATSGVYGVNGFLWLEPENPYFLRVKAMQ
jgi:5-hydroxyisourate hydrolase-like protein (transthyretin family)